MMNTYQKLTESRNLIDEVLARHKGLLNLKHQPAEALAQKQKLFNGVVDSQGAFDVVHAIITLAMANTDVIHIFTDFMAHINEFQTSAQPVTQVYKQGIHQEYLLRERVNLGNTNAVEKLLAIESKLTELIIEAREQAEAKAEVSA
ncbi:hypothetical protein [Vibrio fluvialis]|uniref:hypothetical protein n=1 Tax=Vibrio fluvialis TaxID=676 RepID=UPI001F104861|nr:hypothetical protein [Vibrio fluvialis]